MTMRVAIAHDALVNAGGAERTVTFMAEAFPDAPIFTAAYIPSATFEAFARREIRVLPLGLAVRTESDLKRRFFQVVAAFRRLDLSAFDVVLTSTTFGAKHIRQPRGAGHACYCYAPFRLLWNPGAYGSTSLPVGRSGRVALALARPLLREWDRRVTAAVPALATTCLNMAAEIRRCYGREATVIPVPVRLDQYRVGTGVGDYYLSVSRLVSHKRVDLAIEACRRIGRRLVVAGDGPELPRLRSLADERVTFVGRVPDDRLRDLYAGCRALLFCSHEDYGLAPIEAQASGRPVVALGVGGALETVTDGVSGLFFPVQEVDALVTAMQALEARTFSPEDIRRSVERFDRAPFIAAIREFVHGATG